MQTPSGIAPILSRPVQWHVCHARIYYAVQDRVADAKAASQDHSESSARGESGTRKRESTRSTMVDLLLCRRSEMPSARALAPLTPTWWSTLLQI